MDTTQYGTRPENSVPEIATRINNVFASNKQKQIDFYMSVKPTEGDELMEQHVIGYTDSEIDEYEGKGDPNSEI